MSKFMPQDLPNLSNSHFINVYVKTSASGDVKSVHVSGTEVLPMNGERIQGPFTLVLPRQRKLSPLVPRRSLTTDLDIILPEEKPEFIPDITMPEALPGSIPDVSKLKLN